MTRPSVRNYYRIGVQKVTMEIPEGIRISIIELLRANTELPVKQEGRRLEIIIPGITDFEVVAFYPG